ncbi:MAG: CotS family spore coat protein [Alicyclobacillus macrosporangiidus]|nr:CotS family spore coat protein [Alicyclobacillus macrosporangiidus]
MTVPPEVAELAEKVLSRYDMRVRGMTLITAKSDKGGAIWKLDTDRGPRSLKLLHRAPERSLFSVGAQDYLVGKGARVPQLIETTKGRLATEAGGKLWIVTEWVEPLAPVSKTDLSGAQQLCYGLGEFHRLSRGYVEPSGAAHASRLYRWPKTYAKILNKISWFRTLAQTYSDIPASRALLAAADRYEAQAQEALVRLQQSPYNQLVARSEPEWGLVHQDYGWSNGQWGPGGLWIIDLDGVAFDLPIRDLRKLIASTMDDMGVWDVGWMRGMVEAYADACPIEPELFQVLLIDLALPNEFYKNVKEVVYDPATFMATELEPLLQRLEAAEDSKARALKDLADMAGELTSPSHTPSGGERSARRRTPDRRGETPVPDERVRPDRVAEPVREKRAKSPGKPKKPRDPTERANPSLNTADRKNKKSARAKEPTGHRKPVKASRKADARKLPADAGNRRAKRKGGKTS